MSKTILNVEGMSCPSCIRHVTQALAFRGVAEVEVQLDKGRVAVEHDSSISVGRLIAALEGIGYPAAKEAPSCCCSASA